MKLTVAVIVFGGLCAIIWARPEESPKPKSVDRQFLQRQRDIYRLFRYINQPSYYREIVDLAQNYSIEQNINNYTRPEYAREFLRLYSYGFLERGQIFSIFYEEQQRQAEALFRLFYYANNYDTFYRTAAWARQNVNEGLFLYSISVALAYRPDTTNYTIPPIYEIYPYYFFNTEVIQKAYYYKQRYGPQEQTIYANYSGYYLNLNSEQSMSYYTEDIGINAIYYYYNIYYPFWLSGEEFDMKNTRRGEQFYFMYQQLLARYYLERLSNGLGEIEDFNWELPFRTGYYPSLRYSNGLEFPSRPNYANLQEYFYNYGQRWSFRSRYGYSYTFVQDYERRIRDAIDRGYIYSENGDRYDLFSPEGFNIFGNLLESNADSPNTRYYGNLANFARHLLGYSYQPKDNYRLAPSALEQFETSLRDPAFYQLFKRFILLFQQYKSYLPSYNQSQLYFPGVRIENVEFDRLVTYFEYYDTEITNAIYVSPEEYYNEQFQLRARQYRLNNQPFNYRLNVQSDREYRATVRVYLGPKYDRYGREYSLNENRINFVLFDQFNYDLQAGSNFIQRSSNENRYYRPDRTSAREYYYRILRALNGTEEFQYYEEDYACGFPRRYMLPRGSSNGQTYQFYFIINPAREYQGKKDMYYLKSSGSYYDGYSLGYPFDRPIQYEQLFRNASNSYFYDAQIYFRSTNDADDKKSTIKQ